MIEPIRPSQVRDAYRKALPDEVISAFNELIAESWDGYRANFDQIDVVERIVAKLKLESTDIIYKKHYLDVESVYNNAGWIVEFDKPVAYAGETYKANFTFTKKLK